MFRIVYGEFGEWVGGVGDSFPPTDGFAPRNARFYRSDLAQEYRFNDVTASWAAVSAGAGSIVVQEADGTPAIAGADSLLFDQTDGFVVTDLGGGDARVDLANVPQSAITGLVAALAAADQGSQDTQTIAMMALMGY